VNVTRQVNENTVMTVVIGVAAAGLIMQLAVRLSAIESRLNRLLRLEAKLDAQLKQQGIRFDEFADVLPRRARGARGR
jgi:DNA-directed RNA polymerase